MTHIAYDKYKKSNSDWIGEIPSHWKINRFKIMFSYNKGNNPQTFSDESGEGLAPYLSMEYLRKDIAPTYVPITECHLKANNGDILLLWDGSNAGEFVVSKDGLVSSTMAKLIENISIDNNFSKYLCKAIEPVLRELTIGMGVPHVSSSILNNIQLPNIPHNEQIQIANYLNKETAKINETIDKNEKLIKLLEEKRIALISRIVTKGLNPDTPMKDSGIEWIGEIPETSTIVPFRRICNLNQGLQYPQEKRLDAPIENSKLYITVKYLNSDEKVEEYIPNPIKRVICTEDDVLLARTGATGEVFTNLNGVFHNNFFRINYHDNINKDYLVYYLKMDAVKKILLLKAGVTTIPDLNHGSFLETPFILYDLDEQKEIVNYLDQETSKITKTISKIKENINLLEEYKVSLIHHVVTGKVDVRCEV